MRKYSRALLLGGILALVALFFAAGLHRELSLESIKAHQSRLQELYNQRPAAVIAAFAAVYIPVVALNLPGAAVPGAGRRGSLRRVGRDYPDLICPDRGASIGGSSAAAVLQGSIPQGLGCDQTDCSHCLNGATNFGTPFEGHP